MKNTIHKYIISIFLFTSCSFTKQRIQQSEAYISKNKSLAGEFQNHADSSDSNTDNSLWQHIAPFNKLSYDQSKKSHVKIAIEHKHIHFNLVFDSSIIVTKSFKYRIKDNLLLFKFRKIQGLPFVFYRAQYRKIYLSVDEKNNLHVQLNGSAYGGMLIIIFGSSIAGDYHFKRV